MWLGYPSAPAFVYVGYQQVLKAKLLKCAHIRLIVSVVFAVSIHVANPRTECADKSRAVTIIYRATKVRNFICLYINFVQTLQCLFGVFRVCDVS